MMIETTTSTNEACKPFNVLILDEQFLPQDRISGTNQNEALVHDEDRVDQTTTAECDRSSSCRSTNATLRAGKTAELLYSSVVRPGTSNQEMGEYRQPDATASERSIYDHTLEHCYANVEKDESGRLLNRDTLAFRTSDYEPVKSSAPLVQINGQDGMPHLIDTSASRIARHCDVPVVVHRTNKSADTACMNSVNHRSMIDRTQSDTVSGSMEQVPYHTGRSTFYQRVDSAEGTLYCA